MFQSVPIIVERAMYLNAPDHMFAAGHESAALAAPATEWFLAEGATGRYFDLFVLIANPTPNPSAIVASFLLPDGSVIERSLEVAGKSRRTIWVDAKVNENPQVMRDTRDKFLKYYSVTQGNYDVTNHFLSANPRVIEVDATR